VENVTKILARELAVELRTKRCGFLWYKRRYVASVRIFTPSSVDPYRQSTIALYASDAVESGQLLSPPIPMGWRGRKGFRFDIHFAKGPQSGAAAIRFAVLERVAIIVPPS